MIDPTPVESMLAVVAAILLGLTIVIVIARTCLVPRATPWIVATYVGHLTISLVTFGWLGFLVPDERLYDRVGQRVALYLDGVNTADVTFAAGKEGWVWVLGSIYYVFGHVVQTGLVFNAVAMALVPVAVSNAAVHLGWTRSSKATLIAAIIPPPFLIWGSLLLREALAILAISFSLAFAAKLSAGRNVKAAVGLLLNLVVLFYNRGTAALLVIAGLVVGIVLVGRGGSRRLSGRQVILCLLAVPLALIVLKTGADNFGWSVERASAVREYTADSSISSVGEVTALTDTSSALLTSIVDLPLVTVGPYPWQWSLTGVGLLTAVDAVSWLFVVVFGVVGLNLPAARRGRWLCVIPALGLLLALAVTTGSFGSIVRYRAMALPFLLPLAAAGFVAIQMPAKAPNKVKTPNSMRTH